MHQELLGLLNWPVLLIISSSLILKLSYLMTTILIATLALLLFTSIAQHTLSYHFLIHLIWLKFLTIYFYVFRLICPSLFLIYQSNIFK